MNSIRLSRLRPRVKSYSFVSFGWLVTREAAFHIVYPVIPVSMDESAARLVFARATTSNVRRVAERLLREFPERGWYYG